MVILPGYFDLPGAPDAPINLLLMLFRITYNNRITQVKKLVSHFEYKTIIAPDEYIIHALKTIKKNKKANEKRANEIKSALADTYGEEYFTNQSPLYKALTSGNIVCIIADKVYKYSVEVIPLEITDGK